MLSVDKKAVTNGIQAFMKYVRRDACEHTQLTLAKETGIPQDQLSRYEAGKVLPSLLAAIAIADACDISLDYLVGRCENSNAHKTKKAFKYRED